MRQKITNIPLIIWSLLFIFFMPHLLHASIYDDMKNRNVAAPFASPGLEPGASSSGYSIFGKNNKPKKSTSVQYLQPNSTGADMTLFKKEKKKPEKNRHSYFNDGLWGESSNNGQIQLNPSSATLITIQSLAITTYDSGPLNGGGIIAAPLAPGSDDPNLDSNSIMITGDMPISDAIPYLLALSLFYIAHLRRKRKGLSIN